MERCITLPPSPSVSNGEVSVGINTIGFHPLCIECKCGISSERGLEAHLVTKHLISDSQSRRVSQEVWEKKRKMASALQCSPLWQAYLAAPDAHTIHTPRTLDPLIGLEVYDGYQCILCSSCYTEMKTLKVHLRKAHSSNQFFEDKARATFRWPLKLQTLFASGRLRKYFPVSLNNFIGDLIVVSSVSATSNSKAAKPDSHSNMDVGKSPIFDTRKTAAAAKEISNMLTKLNGEDDAEEADEKLKSTFVSISRVNEILKDRKLPLSEAHWLGSNEPSDAKLRSLINDDVSNYLMVMPEITLDMPPSVLTWCNVRSKGERQIPFRTVSAKACKQYSSEIVRFVEFLFRAIQSRPDLVDSRTQEVFKDYLAFCSSSSESDDVRREKQKSRRQKLMHNLLKITLLRYWSFCQSTRTMSVKTFFSTRCVTRDGEQKYRFCQPWEITKPLAALQYAISSCAIREVYSFHNKRNQEQLVTDENQVSKDALEKLRDCVRIDHNNVASFVRNMLDISMSLMNQEDINVSFESCLQHKNCGIVRDVHISLNVLGGKVCNAHQETEDLFHSKLLFRRGVSKGFINQINSLRDDLSSRTVGFCFLSSKRAQKFLEENIAHVLSLLKISANVTGIESTLTNNEIISLFGVNIFKSKAIEWLNWAQQLQHLLLFCIHISSGSPARATELSTLRLRNEAHGMRNIFLSQGRIMIITRYQKTRSLKGFARPIPRFPDKKTSDLLMQYIMLIKPVEVALVGLFHGKEAGTSHWNRLFVSNGISWKEPQIRSIISKRLVFDNVRLLFNEYRCYSVGMVPIAADGKAKGIVEEIRREALSIGHQQAGHSIEMAERAYARTREDLYDLHHSSIQAHRQFSNEWHDLLAISVSSASTKCHIQENDLDRNVAKSLLDSHHLSSEERHRKRLKSNQGSRLNVVASGGQEDIRRSQNDKVIFSSQIEFDYGGAHRPKNIAATFNSKSALCAPTLIAEDPDRYEHMLPFFLSQMRTMLRDPSATFKSQTQFNVTAAVTEKRDNIFAIMPTGSGKSLCVLLPTFMARGALSTILIVPLVSLVKEFERRALNLDLTISTTVSTSHEEHVDLYILTPEKVRSESFTRLTTSLLMSNTLGLVVVDEAHLTAMWSSFRQALRDIRYALLQLPSGIPRLFLSATVPPPERSTVVSVHGEKFARVFSMPTVRHNLKFLVHNCDQTLKEKNRSSSGCYMNNRQSMLQATVDKIKSELPKLSEEELLLSPTNTNHLPFFRVLIYVMRRKDVENYADVLGTLYVSLCSSPNNEHQDLDIQMVVLHYHAAMGTEGKENMHGLWCAPNYLRKAGDSDRTVKVVVMVSTCAFGAGIDASNVRLVVHVGGSTSLKDYAQETGRAGRDGETARCIVLYSKPFADNFQRQLEIIDRETHSEDSHKNIIEWMEMRRWMETVDLCRKNWLYSTMDGTSPGVCMFNGDSENCDICEKRSFHALERDDPFSGSQVPIPTRPQMYSQHGRMEREPPKRKVPDSFDTQSLPFYETESQPSAIALSLSTVISQCEAFVREFKVLCLPCFISTGRYIRLVDHSRCPWMARRCLQCHDVNHGCRRCPNKTKTTNGTCFRCGMSYSKGKKLHSEEMGFGNSCQLATLRDLGWCLWRKDKVWREKLVNDLFEDAWAQQYNSFLEKDSECPDVPTTNMDLMFTQWMSKKTSDTPNLLLLGSWWSHNRLHHSR